MGRVLSVLLYAVISIIGAIIFNLKGYEFKAFGGIILALAGFIAYMMGRNDR